jgi:hypothetical protein
MKHVTEIRDQPYRHMLAGVSFRPVFIIGEHRSGTTILYKLLAQTGAFNVVRYYHITHYDQILYNHVHQRTATAKAELAAYMAEIGLRDRYFDHIRVHPDLPEEYSFVLKRHASVINIPRTNRRNRHMLVELCRKIQVAAQQDRPVLLKNPWDSANFIYLNRAFPLARFIFIHRHPLPTVNSKLKAMRGILAEQNKYSALLDPAYAQLHERPWLARLACTAFSSIGGLDVRLITLLNWYSARYYLRNIPKLDSDDFIELTYEQLCRRPDETITGILSFLELTAQNPIDFGAEIKPRPLKLLPTIAARKAYIQNHLQSYMAWLNYNPI